MQMRDHAGPILLNIRISFTRQELIYCSNKPIPIAMVSLDDIQYLASNLPTYVRVDNQLKYALACIAFNPIFWNIAARLEYKGYHQVNWWSPQWMLFACLDNLLFGNLQGPSIPSGASYTAKFPAIGGISSYQSIGNCNFWLW